jgi:lipopolysaccharide biosynthesis protein
LTFLKKICFPLQRKLQYNLAKLEAKCIIAVQVHIYYEDLINEIINKTNNIPIKFDLFISTISLTKKKKIEKYLKLYSKANKYEVKIVENKGRDILPFITQMKFKFKNYKYICHIHTKKSKHDILLGSNWRNFLYENLLGTKEIISEILIEFENYEKLGFMFPEAYYQIIKNIDNYDLTEFPLHKPNIKYMNFILSKIFYRFKIGNKIIFPSGDMFWAKVNAIYQIFKIRFINKFPKELNQTNETIMHGIERIWLYLVKLNGYYYKIIFKHY